MKPALAVNGLLMPPDFPDASFERVYARFSAGAGAHPAYQHFSGAWNAISFRFLTMTDEGTAFASAIGADNAHGDLALRYSQERHLFGFFGSSFSVFESFFYGMFALGAVIRPAEFPMATAKDQQAISPSSTNRAYCSAFPGDLILNSFSAVFGDNDYKELREVRNILTHRTAPGRTIFVGIGTDEELAAVWKLNNIPLDTQLVPTRRQAVSRLLHVLMDAAAVFVESRMP